MAQNAEYERLEVNRNPDDKEQVLRVRIRVYNYFVVFYWNDKIKRLKWFINPIGKQVAIYRSGDICDTALFKKACKQAGGIFASSRRKMQEKKKGATKQLILPF